MASVNLCHELATSVTTTNTPEVGSIALVADDDLGTLCSWNADEDSTFNIDILWADPHRVTEVNVKLARSVTGSGVAQVNSTLLYYGGAWQSIDGVRTANYVLSGTWEGVTGVRLTCRHFSGGVSYGILSMYEIKAFGDAFSDSGLRVGAISLGAESVPTALRIKAAAGIIYLGLVPVGHTAASPLRIYTPSGVMAVAKKG